MWLGRVLIFVVLCACASAEGEGGKVTSKVVNTAQGPVRGHRDPDFDLFVFYNIPYATAPKGKDRFKAPLPPPIWTSIRDAVDEKITCPQADPTNSFANVLAITPDCLIANIYIPDTKETNLPVIVSIHGGAYQMGLGEMFTLKHLVNSKKVIVVNFNYRLGVHGFLCLGTPDVPGNAGMKDQVALLRWVNKNIASFGGNPNDVTIDGYSAGSSAVDLLLLSKSAKGLFHKAIPESGANLAPWSVQIDPIANAKEYALNKLNFNNVDDIYALEEFYKTVPFDSLMQDTFYLEIKNDFVFVPCVERDTGTERFLEDAPVNILKSGDYNKVPMLYGFAKMEGLFRVNLNYDGFEKAMNHKFSDYLPHDLQFKNDEEKEKVARRVKQFYFGDKPIGEDTILGYIDYYTDTLFAYATLWSTRLQVEAGNDKVFLYEFSFFDENQTLPAGFDKNVPGANHCAQTAIVYDGTPTGIGVSDDDEKNLPEKVKTMKSLTREIWLNFVITGTPVTEESDLEWPAANASCEPYMELTLPPVLHGAMLPARKQLWDEIYDKYYRAPTPPPPPPTRRTDL